MHVSFRRIALGTLAAGAFAVSAFAAPVVAQTAQPLQVGSIAPDFTVNAATRYGPLADPIQLSDFRGKTVVLAFFPRARTRGCTIQMHSYRDQYAELFHSGQDVVLIAMSVDPVDDLYSWARDDQFQFLMASDAGMQVASQYGAGRDSGMTNRNLFVIAPDGTLAFQATPFREIDPTAYEELGAAIAGTLNGTAAGH